ncbi:MAG: AAA family ATPase [Rubricella sp.]
MPNERPMLHLLCGKIASGKSTLAARLAAETGAVVIAEDAWLHALFEGELHTLDDYARCSARVRAAMEPHVVALLEAGVSVVLDFPANTPGQRRWARSMIDASGAAHRLHLLDIPDAVCLERLRARNADGTHPFVVTEALFHAVTGHFSTPTAEEGFTIERHDAERRDSPPSAP